MATLALRRRFALVAAAVWTPRRDAIAAIVRAEMARPVTEDPHKSSMLALGVLGLIENLAAATTGAVLEVGAYTGGSIIAASRGVRPGDPRKIITIERGGAHLSHPTMPTDDVLRDLAANLARAGLADRVTVIAADAREAYRQLPGLLAGERVGLLIVDADGLLGFHLPALAPLLAPGCVLVLDDYYEEHKGQRMRAYLAEISRNGAVEGFGVCGFGTWIGRLRNAALLPRRPFVHDLNFAWQCPFECAAPGDTDDEPERSAARLFENGRELGPAHSKHQLIRYVGMGRWSHWGNGMLYLSASDNTDPTLNGRRYELEVDGTRIRLA